MSYKVISEIQVVQKIVSTSAKMTRFKVDLKGDDFPQLDLLLAPQSVVSYLFYFFVLTCLFLVI